jgi:hypothetical protein
MSDPLWCPECRHSRPNEPSWLFTPRCEQCGAELEDEPAPFEVDFKEIDIGYKEGDENEENEEAEGKEEDAGGDNAEAE